MVPGAHQGARVVALALVVVLCEWLEFDLFMSSQASYDANASGLHRKLTFSSKVNHGSEA